MQGVVKSGEETGKDEREGKEGGRKGSFSRKTAGGVGAIGDRANCKQWYVSRINQKHKAVGGLTRFTGVEWGGKQIR